MKAIILAAGMSSRLGALTKELPKCCLQVYAGVSMLERNLMLLKDAGFKSVTIVTGHASSSIEDLVDKKSGLFENLTTLFNPHYHDRNNIYSVYLCSNAIDTQTLIMNSDLVVSSNIVNLAAKAIRDSKQTFMMVDDTNAVDDESMKVYVDSNDHIVRVHKSLELDRSLGEYIGLMRVSDDDVQTFIRSMSRILDDGGLQMYYEDAMDQALGSMNVGFVSTSGESWTEVDTVEDLEIARTIAESFYSELKN